MLTRSGTTEAKVEAEAKAGRYEVEAANCVRHNSARIYRWTVNKIDVAIR